MFVRDVTITLIIMIAALRWGSYAPLPIDRDSQRGPVYVSVDSTYVSGQVVHATLSNRSARPIAFDAISGWVNDNVPEPDRIWSPLQSHQSFRNGMWKERHDYPCGTGSRRVVVEPGGAVRVMLDVAKDTDVWRARIYWWFADRQFDGKYESSLTSPCLVD